MSQTVWRIATDTPAYEADDLAGVGAKITGGRWNEAGAAMIYASQSMAMACLETLIHLNAGALPFNRFLVQLDIPGWVWTKGQHVNSASLKVGWDAEPAGRVSIDFGTKWITSKSSAVLIVPSAIIPEEFNVLINPQHPDSSAITATKVRKWLYDPRLRAN